MKKIDHMNKLTKDVSQALKIIYNTGFVEGMPELTITSLHDCGLLAKDNKLTQKGKMYALSKMPLSLQCKELAIPLVDIQLYFERKPEQALLKYFELEGYIGTCVEGMGVLTIIKALMLDKLTEYNFFKCRSDACSRYLEAQLYTLKEFTDEIVNSISTTNICEFSTNIKEILNEPFMKSEYPQLSIEFAEALYFAIDIDTFINVAYKIAEDPYAFRCGWPDLTIVKGKEVRFIEVKTTDKLKESQLVTISTMSKILPYEFSVYRLN